MQHRRKFISLLAMSPFSHINRLISGSRRVATSHPYLASVSYFHGEAISFGSGEPPSNQSDYPVDLRRGNTTEIMRTKCRGSGKLMVAAILSIVRGPCIERYFSTPVINYLKLVDNLVKFCPTKEEMEPLKNYTGDRANIVKCEQIQNSFKLKDIRNLLLIGNPLHRKLPEVLVSHTLHLLYPFQSDLFFCSDTLVLDDNSDVFFLNTPKELFIPEDRISLLTTGKEQGSVLAARWFKKLWMQSDRRSILSVASKLRSRLGQDSSFATKLKMNFTDHSFYTLTIVDWRATAIERVIEIIVDDGQVTVDELDPNVVHAFGSGCRLAKLHILNCPSPANAQEVRLLLQNTMELVSKNVRTVGGYARMYDTAEFRVVNTWLEDHYNKDQWPISDQLVRL